MRKIIKQTLKNQTSDLTLQSKGNEGFTLIELLLVIALISISVGVTSDILVSLTRSYNKTTVYNEIEQQANFVGIKLEKELRNSTNVTVTNGGNTISFNLNGVVIYYNVATSGSYTNIYRSTGASSTASTDALVATPTLTGNALGVNTTCIGTCFTVTGSSPQVVDISMNFAQASGGGSSYSGNIVLKNTIVIRNTY